MAISGIETVTLRCKGALRNVHLRVLALVSWQHVIKSLVSSEIQCVARELDPQECLKQHRTSSGLCVPPRETNGCKDLRFYQREKVKQPWSFNKGYCHFDCSFIMPPWHPFLHHFTIVFQLQEIIKAIYAADAANGSFYYKSVFHPGGLRAMPDPHSRYSKAITLVSGEIVTHANFWVRRTQHFWGGPSPLSANT